MSIQEIESGISLAMHQFKRLGLSSHGAHLSFALAKDSDSHRHSLRWNNYDERPDVHIKGITLEANEFLVINANRLREWQREEDELRADIDSLQQQLQMKERDCTESQQLLQQQHSLQVMIHSLIKQAEDEFEAQHHETKQQLIQRTKQLQDVHQAYEALEQNCYVFKTLYEQTEHARGEEAARLNQVHDELNSVEKQRDELETEARDLIAQLVQTKMVAAEQSMELDECKSMITQLRATVHLLHRQIETIEQHREKQLLSQLSSMSYHKSFSLTLDSPVPSIPSSPCPSIDINLKERCPEQTPNA